MTISTHIVSDFNSIAEQDWEQLEHADNPFLSYAFLGALESSGSIDAGNGWKPHHLALIDGDELVAFAPTYIKTNSHGEFVFDWTWADAYHRHGLNYYPKLLTGIPYSPVTGPRLLTRKGYPDPAALRNRLLEFAQEECEKGGFSTWHCNFVSKADDKILQKTPLLSRKDWQFHWHNRDYRDFDAFLGELRSRKRKNIRRERRQVHEAGISFQWINGSGLTGDDLDFVYRCYVNTFNTYGNHPALRKAFFISLAEQLQDRLLVIMAIREDQPVAMGLFLSGGGCLYGRYWGCTEDHPGLHFEVAYYQGIEFCIREGISIFESGAQGEHKISRGFVPTATWSYHLVREDMFRTAIAEYLDRENVWRDEYRAQLLAHDPYRRDQS